MEIEIGERVIVNKVYEVEKSNWPDPKSRKMVIRDMDPVECIYLGSGQRWDGFMDTDDGRETFGAVYYWVNTEMHYVNLVQPIDKGGRFRKPLAVPEWCVVRVRGQ